MTSKRYQWSGSTSWIVVCFALTLLGVVGCGGGSGGSATPKDNGAKERDSGAGDTGFSDPPQPSLSGRVFFDNAGVISTFDLGSKTISPLYKFPAKSHFISHNNGLHAVTFFNEEDVKDHIYVFEIATQKLLYHLQTGKQFRGPAVISRDGSLLAVFHRDFGNPELRIYKVAEGNLVSMRAIDSVAGNSAIDIRSWTWLPRGGRRASVSTLYH